MQIDKDGKKVVVKKTENELKGHGLVLRPNDFPYCFDETVQHYCLWKLGGEVVEDDVAGAMRELKRSIEFTEYTYYINPPNLKSIQDVSHAHILIKVEPRNRKGCISDIFWRIAMKLRFERTRKVVIYSSIGIGIFGVSMVLRIYFQAKLFVTDAQDIINHFSTRKLFRFYVNFFAPFSTAIILKYFFPKYLKR